MRHWKRLVYYLIINILVSACATLAVLSAWDRIHTSRTSEGTPTVAALANTTPLVLLPETPGTISSTEAQQVTSEAPDLTATIPADTNPTDSAGNVIYTVKENDTLGALASEYNVSVEEIMAASGLSDPNHLSIGQVLTIPVGLAEPTATLTPTQALTLPVVTATTLVIDETPVPQTGEPGVVIDSVVGAGDLDTERVMLRRTGPGELSLAGWQLRSADGQSFTFPQLNLFESGAVYLHTRAGQDTVVDLFWGLDKPVFTSGEKIELLDDQGIVRATYTIP
jgi:hypothetical protein